MKFGMLLRSTRDSSIKKSLQEKEDETLPCDAEGSQADTFLLGYLTPVFHQNLATSTDMIKPYHN